MHHYIGLNKKLLLYFINNVSFLVIFWLKYCPKTPTMATAFPTVQVISMVASMSLVLKVSIEKINLYNTELKTIL